MTVEELMRQLDQHPGHLGVEIRYGGSTRGMSLAVVGTSVEFILSEGPF